MADGSDGRTGITDLNPVVASGCFCEGVLICQAHRLAYNLNTHSLGEDGLDR